DLRERVRDLAQHPGEARVLGLEADGCAFDPLADRMRLVVSAFERPGDVVGNRLEHLAGFVVELRGGGKLGVQALEVSLELFSRHGRSLKSRSPCGLCAYPTTRSGSANGHEGRAAWRRPPVLLVIGFLLAFVATVLTVVLTGLFVRAPLERST